MSKIMSNEKYEHCHFLFCEDLMKKYIKWSEDYKDALDIYYSLVDQVSD